MTSTVTVPTVTIHFTQVDVVAIFGVGCAVPMQYYNQLTVYFAMPIVGLAGIWLWYLINRFVKGADPEESLDGAWNTVQTFLFMVTVTVAVTITATITVSITVHYHLSHLLFPLPPPDIPYNRFGDA